MSILIALLYISTLLTIKYYIKRNSINNTISREYIA